MSSLFGDLFKAPGGAKSDGLFSEHSKFKASREPVVAAQASKPAKSNKEDKGSKRKREAAAAEPAPQKKSSKKEDKKDKLIEKAAINPDGEPKTTAAAAAAGEGKSNKGRAKQAAKVSAAAAKARTATEETTNKGGEPNVAASALQNASKKVENRKGKKAATAPGSASEPVKKQKLKAIQKEAHALKKSSETRKVGDNKPSLASAAQNEGLGGKSEGAVDGVGGEAEKLERTIFVGNVPPATKRKALAALFSQ